MADTTPLAALRAYLDELDAQTRLPGEPPLREAVAEQARQRLAEMDRELVDPCDYCSHDNTEHAEDGCRLCPCAVPQ